MASRIYEAQQQHLLDLQENCDFGADPKSWLSGDDFRQTLSSLSTAAATASATGNVDKALFNDLVEIVPLVQCLIDGNAKPAFMVRSSMAYTKAPSKESLYEKAVGRSTALPAKKRRDQGDKDLSKNSCSNQEGGAENSIRTLLSEKDREELIVLRDQVEDLKRQLSDKEELLEASELSKSEMAAISSQLAQFKNEAAEKDSVIKSIQLQLTDTKIKLADKQAAVEKLQWETTTSNKKVERLQKDLDRAQGEISDIMLLIQSLTRNDSSAYAGESYDVSCLLNQSVEIDCDMDLQLMEAAREACIAAVEAAKEKQDEESMAAATSARLYLQSFVL